MRPGPHLKQFLVCCNITQGCQLASCRHISACYPCRFSMWPKGSHLATPRCSRAANLFKLLCHPLASTSCSHSWGSRKGLGYLGCVCGLGPGCPHCIYGGRGGWAAHTVCEKGRSQAAHTAAGHVARRGRGCCACGMGQLGCMPWWVGVGGGWHTQPEGEGELEGPRNTQPR